MEGLSILTALQTISSMIASGILSVCDREPEVSSGRV